MVTIPAYISKVETLKDRTWKVTVLTQELTPDKVAGIVQMLDSFGFMAFKQDKFKTDEIKMLESLKSDYEDSNKSQAQRIKSILYVLWHTNDDEGFDDFEDYYRHKTNKYINFLKAKIDQ